jgi:glucosylglycerol 3-phosphatase
MAAGQLGDSFAVLTNGEHEGRRGVNRLVEQALYGDHDPAQAGLYLRGLAAGGVQFQDRYGHLSHPGVSEAEIAFLAAAPSRMEALLKDGLPELFPLYSLEQIAQLSHAAVLDTQVSPTVNLNGIFALIPGDDEKQRTMQNLLQRDGDIAGLCGAAGS